MRESKFKRITKRDGSIVDFDGQKIWNAISKANKEVVGNNKIDDYDISSVTDAVIRSLNIFDHQPSVEEIQDLVVDTLAANRFYGLMRLYSEYRFKRALIRQSNSTDESILSLIRGTNKDLDEENSNKSTRRNSTQRDYIAGEVSRDISRRLLLPENVVRAHDEGILHFHDLDYFIQPEFNCFHSSMRFVTKDGIRRFKDCKVGEEVEVLDKDGVWRTAVVNKFGKQRMYTVRMHAGRSKKEVVCTKDHRWILDDGTVTTDLKAGDSLYARSQNVDDRWVIDEIVPYDMHEYDAWCVTEPVTHTFTLEGGVVTGNCQLVALGDMLDNGTVMNGKMIESPHTFRVACTVATQIIAAVASNQYGGQTVDVSHFGKYLRRSRERFEDRVKESHIPDDEARAIVDSLLQDELEAGVQTIQYQINTLMTTNGQAPFVTLWLYIRDDDPYIEENVMIIEEILKQRLKGIKNEVGVYITPAFPKLIYVLDENNNLTGGKYDYVTRLAAKCTAKRMYPDYISAKKMKETYQGNVVPVMGCRSILSPWKDEKGAFKFEGRFNCGVVSINLPQIAIVAEGDEEKFWKLFDERLELCFEALMCKHKACQKINSDNSPIHWQHGAIARLPQHSPITELLYGGYSTISLGYIGLYEVTKLMTGVSHTDPKGTEFALRVMHHLRETTDRWKAENNIGFALYGTPAESLCYRFARIDRAKYGVIKDVTDKGYYTNSYHVDVREKINAFDKLRFESQFQKISAGGCISYVEIPNMQKNIPALESMIKFIYNEITYAEFNTKSDYCQVCGFDGEIQINDEGEWVCPQCGNKDHSKMNVVRRTCGYLGENFWNKGKTEEIKERVLHVS